ncbi:unnamed protein product, partial [Iphiclides podalirius]
MNSAARRIVEQEWARSGIKGQKCDTALVWWWWRRWRPVDGAAEAAAWLYHSKRPRGPCAAKMIGAMPAVAVRHERRRAEKRGAAGRRASALPARDDDPEPAHRLRSELYVCGKLAALHAVVGSLLLGIVVLVVGLVQLSPGAEAAQHRYYLMGAGASLVGAGLLGAGLRCICLHWYKLKFREDDTDSEQGTHKNGVSVVESGHGHGHDGHKAGHDGHKAAHERPKLKSQASVGRDHDLIKQPSAASDA